MTNRTTLSKKVFQRKLNFVESRRTPTQRRPQTETKQLYSAAKSPRVSTQEKQKAQNRRITSTGLSCTSASEGQRSLL